MNLPNLLTTARILLVPVFLYAFLTHRQVGGLIAAAVFIIAAITDSLDGYLARKNKLVTRLGKFLDPLADKLLVTAALVSLVQLGLISTWVAMVIIGRELAVTGLRAIAAAEGTVIAAGPWGKAKTVVQICFIVAAILTRALPRFFWLKYLADFLFTPLLWAAVLLTIWSGVDYFVAYYRGLKAQKATPPAPRRPLKFRFTLPLRSRRREKR
ncbi:MAG: CDP-diacylglycerol--glycerol-3-phosphate 3-phosphatidyltransferase [Mycobacterium leprae]